MADALLVVDMLRGFLEKGHPLYCGDGARRIIPKVRRLLRREGERGSCIFYICDEHRPDDLEFKMFPPHCLSGSVEAELIPELQGYPGEVMKKRRYSGFFGTVLEERLRRASSWPRL